jgi:hypothetical protein
MTQGKIIRKPWKRNLAGLRELADWAGVSRPAIYGAINSVAAGTGFPEPVDHLSMGNVWSFAEAVAALEKMGFSEGGGARNGGGVHRG